METLSDQYVTLFGPTGVVTSAVVGTEGGMLLFVTSGFMAALAGLLLAARLGAVRGNTADGFELDIITMVLLGGVSIFGGSGTLTGVFLSILIILNLRNGMSLVNITGNTQTGVIGLLLILSVLLPNWVQGIGVALKRRR